ncbi:tetratricopeptide repeat protein [Candidatus Leptofilum sp.]|uniref:tetratricopeptide repeat protein n=1 Tax=Candidatus Leptofilum sp. TaxID=3241576 RepID=UPI003B5CFF3C
MPQKDERQHAQLLEEMKAHFNLAEIRTLCLNLEVDFDELAGEEKSSKIRELILYMERKGRWADLLAEVKASQPKVGSIKNLVPPPHIPYHQNKLFTGREEWLTKLHDALHQDEPVAVTQAVAGLGGVGKTQLALAYCYRHLNDYDLIQWLRADDAVTLGGELAELAYRLGLARRSVTDQPALHQLALNWLHTTNKRWLLVYDNADAIQPNELRPFLPKMGHGACLITSRNPNWGGLAQTLRLTHFSDAEAVAFLLGQSEMSSEAIAAHPQGADAKALAHLLGNLPLALEHARAYVEQTGCTLADYASYFANERAELWGEELSPPADYDEKTIITTWELAFAQAKQTPGAAELLNLCCFLAPDDIPLDVIMAAVEAVREPPLPEELIALAESKLKLDKAIAALRRYSLLARDGDRLTLHRMVQTVARDQMQLEIRKNCTKITVSLLLQALPHGQPDLTTWEHNSHLLPHLLAVIDEAEKIVPMFEKTSVLLSIAEGLLFYSGFTILQRKLGRIHKSLEPGDLMVGLDIHSLGAMLLERGDYEAARPYLERAVVIGEESLGTKNPIVASRLNTLGQLLQAKGEPDAARPYLERALAIDEKALGPDHPNVAIRLNNLATLLQAVGEYGAARPLIERALAICEAKLGADHPNTNIVRGNLAALLAEMEGKS